MKTLLLTNVFPPQTGGSGRWFWEIYSRMPRDEYIVVAGEHLQAEEFDAGHQVNVKRQPLLFPDYGTFSVTGFKRYRKAAHRVLDIVDAENVEAIHCGALLPDGWIGRMVARKRGIPLLQYIHGEEPCYTDSSRELNWMARRVLSEASRVVVNSHNTARITREHWRLPESKVHVLHPGVDCARFKPAERNLEVRRRLNWGDRPVILTVGRLQKRKGHDMLIRALPAIREQIPDVLYAIVGDGEERTPLEKLIAERDLSHHVQFHGEPTDCELIECYQQCNLFVLPNRQIGGDIEGFGIVLLEAQACGKPVFAGDSGGTSETMLVGETGFVLDCRDAASLSASVRDTLSQPDRLEHLGLAARDHVVSDFDWSALATEAIPAAFGTQTSERKLHVETSTS